MSQKIRKGLKNGQIYATKSSIFTTFAIYLRVSVDYQRMGMVLGRGGSRERAMKQLFVALLVLLTLLNFVCLVSLDSFHYLMRFEPN